MGERFASVSEDELREKYNNETITELGFRMIS